MTAFNLFALTSDASRRILRLPLSKDVQQEITYTFTQQESAFNNVAQHEFVFDGKYKPDDGECLIINDYDDIDNLHGAIANPLSIPEISPDPAEFSIIKALFTGYSDAEGESIALIQSFDRRKIISTSGISIFHSNNVYKKVDGIGITIDARLSAILNGKTLKFLSFHSARQVFDLSEYYIEATDADIKEFVAIRSVQVADIPRLIAISDSWVRRKVALIKQSQILETVAIDVIKKTALTFDIILSTIMIDGREAIILPSEKPELKKLLRFLDEDYYQSSLLNKNYVTSSKRLA